MSKFTQVQLDAMMARNPQLSIDGSGVLTGMRALAHLANLKPGEDAEMFPEVKTVVVERKKKVKQPNKTEAEFGAYLRVGMGRREVKYECYTFKLGDDCRYTPDWSALGPDGTLELYEIKGAYLFKGATKSATASSLTKPKTAATMYPHAFYIAQKDAEGCWTCQRLNGMVDEIW